MLDLVVCSLFVDHSGVLFEETKPQNFDVVRNIDLAIWNCIRLILEVVKFTDNLPTGYSGSRYLVCNIVNIFIRVLDTLYSTLLLFLLSCRNTATHGFSSTLHYKWMSFVNMRANIAAYVGEIPLVENEEQIIHDHSIFKTRPRRESSYILRTVLKAANSIPLLATILTTLPNYIVLH